MKVKKGDKVRVMAGKDRGKEGTVERVWLEGEKIAIAGVNVYKKHLRPQSEGKKGGIVDFSRPLPAAKVALVCPKCEQATRIGYKLAAKEKIRVCRKCENEI
jgi:large subunit ribosomal protein L24